MADYTFDDALTLAKPFVKNVPTTAVGLFMCDIVNSRIWTAYPWEWTQAALTSIALSDGVQDYSIGNADFYRPVELWITRTDLTPDEYTPPLRIAEFLPPELATKTGWPNFRVISRDSQSLKLRLESAASVPSGVVLQIDGKYQKVPTKLSATTATIPHSDKYFEVTVAGLLYYLYKFTDDPRAGSISIDGRGNRQYTGQFAMFMNSLKMMMMEEDAKNGVPLIFPDEPISGMPSFTPGIYGP